MRRQTRLTRQREYENDHFPISRFAIRRPPVVIARAVKVSDSRVAEGPRRSEIVNFDFLTRRYELEIEAEKAYF